MIDQKTRTYIYGIIVAAIPLLVAAGFIAQDEAQLWLTLAAAVLGLGAAGLAKPNSNPKKVQVIDIPDGTGTRRRTDA